MWLRDPAALTPPPLPRRLRDRVRFAGPADGSEAQHLSRASIAVAASAGTAPAPQLLLRALAGGAVPVASRLPSTRRCSTRASWACCSSRATP